MKKIKHLGAPILSLRQFAKLRSKLKGKMWTEINNVIIKI